MRPLTPALVLSLLAGALGAGCARSDRDTVASSPAEAPAKPSEAPAQPASARPSDTLQTSAGPLVITPVHHATLWLQWGGKTIAVDPWSDGDLDGLPPADLVLVTDIHFDHLDAKAIERVRRPGAEIVAPPAVAAQLPSARVLKNGDTLTAAGVPIEAVPMYNLVRGPKDGEKYHDKGRGNGYVLTFGATRVYVAGDTECTPEMRALSKIDVAFLPMNLPYTMPPAEAAECAKAFRPKILYPYHYKGSDLGELTKALAGEKDIEVRVRSWY